MLISAALNQRAIQRWRACLDHCPASLIHCARVQLSVRNCFVRGSVVRYVHLPPNSVDKDMLHDATRRQQRGQ